MTEYLISLTGPLIGYYLKVKAKNEACVRRWARDNVADLWCSVYKTDFQFKTDPKIIGAVEEIWNYREDEE